jgi:tetratricopeptide (TPR) repeat protein
MQEMARIFALEVTAMYTFKRCLRIRFTVLWGTAGTLLLTIIAATPSEAKTPRLPPLVIDDMASSQQPPAKQDQTEALAEYQKALDANPRSSLAYYRIAEILFEQRQFQASVNACRDALRGDSDPSWTRVWSHIQMGKIFDVTGQRERALNQYRLAVETGDNTRGAVDEAQKLLEEPFTQPPEH